MRALVVFESLFGNTATVGETIAASLRAHGVPAEAVSVDRVDPAATEGVNLLVVGGPTHVHGMSRESTRKAGAADARNTYAEPTIAPGLREWFERLPAGVGRSAAAFDTRIDKPVLVTGSAAKGIAKRLRRAGFGLLGGPESFVVTTDNALADGEVEHASAWGATLATRIPAGSTG